MSDDNLETAAPGASGRTDPEIVATGATVDVGGQLRSAREAKGLSIDDVSAALKLSPRQVQDLEANEWSRLPKTIIRGFVRNYARHLDLDAARLMAGLDGMPLPQGPELAMQVGAPVNMPKEGRTDRRDFVRVFSGLIILLLAVLLYFFVPADLWHASIDSLKGMVFKQAAAPQVAAVGAGDNAREAAPVVPPTVVVVPDNAPATDVPPQSATPADAAPSATPGATAGATLVFSFTRPSWVEVRDRSGQIIFSQLSQAGMQREITGQAPFSLVVGNASNVTLRYRGKTVDLSKRSKDDVARLTLE